MQQKRQWQQQQQRRTTMLKQHRRYTNDKATLNGRPLRSCAVLDKLRSLNEQMTWLSAHCSNAGFVWNHEVNIGSDRRADLDSDANAKLSEEVSEMPTERVSAKQNHKLRSSVPMQATNSSKPHKTETDDSCHSRDFDLSVVNQLQWPLIVLKTMRRDELIFKG